MRRLVIAVVLVAAPGCKDDEPAHVVRKTIGRDGGQVSSHDDVLTLLFQPGSLPGDTEIEVFPSDTPPAIFGPAYRVKPNIEIDVPMDVTYRRVLPNDPVGTAIAVVRRADFEAGHGEWVALPVTELDPEHDLVAGIDNEISLYYGLLEDAFEPPTTTSGPTTTDPPTTDPMTTMEESESGDPDTSDTEVQPLSFAADVAPILSANCIDDLCHAAGVNNPNLEEDAYAHIVDQPSLVAAADLVVPGDSTLSYLMHKLDATHNIDAALGGCGCNGSGLSMPQGRPLLPTDTRAIIRRWIDDGAAP